MFCACKLAVGVIQDILRRHEESGERHHRGSIPQIDDCSTTSYNDRRERKLVRGDAGGIDEPDEDSGKRPQ